MYVGDSPSDLAPLTAADVGIVVGANPLLRTVAAAAGLALHPLVAGEGPCSANDGARVLPASQQLSRPCSSHPLLTTVSLAKLVGDMPLMMLLAPCSAAGQAASGGRAVRGQQLARDRRLPVWARLQRRPAAAARQHSQGAASAAWVACMPNTRTKCPEARTSAGRWLRGSPFQAGSFAKTVQLALEQS